jgi:hypothetical protein
MAVPHAGGMPRAGVTRLGAPVGVSERLERWGAWAGIAFGILFVVRFVAFLDTPDSDAAVSEWTDYYSDSDHRTESIVGMYLMALAGLAFAWFLMALHTRLREAEEPVGFTTWLALGTGLVFVAMLFASGAMMGAVAAGVEFGDIPVPDGEFARQFESVGFGLLLLFGMFAAGVFMIAAALSSMRTALLPQWLAIAGIVSGALVLVFGVLFIPMALLVLWVVTVSIVLLRGHPV